MSQDSISRESAPGDDTENFISSPVDAQNKALTEPIMDHNNRNMKKEPSSQLPTTTTTTATEPSSDIG